MKIEYNCSLLPWNTFGMDVKARVFAQYASVSELCDLLTLFKGENLLHIGRGSNLLFTKDYDGVVLHSEIQDVCSVDIDEDLVCVRAGSGVIFDELVAQTVQRGWGGIENLSYIPGEVGASAVQNIGAYGVEVKDVISRVYAVDVLTHEERVFGVDECRYAYRDSIFKNELRGRYIITFVEFMLSKKPHLKLDYGNLKAALSEHGNPSVADVREAIISVRRQKLPEVSELGSAGSFFKNPVVSEDRFNHLQSQYPNIPHYAASDGVKIPAAWLIEQCGWKGKRHGGAQVYEKQPLVIVNKAEAKPQDIIDLAEEIRKSIKSKFNIEINPEVNYI